ncbi:hypothetical protein AA13594_0697 [Gluconacetobacter azotocaptans DSM 13594]|uniref:DUF3363 domain-containing protein n=1 Tax=Gluconacetobacter azotocaptans TaxID=142834 RepID=UPI001F03FBDE|nr:DUF3363 domain-containing protein [Gluconacetobacter azotocaptans]GBQ27700.1 hypothetical protein AA13594_0697 [Gluconacetobacter azotocaptans DSM 13594]
MDETAEPTLREMGQRDDIIKRIHRGLSEQGLERAVSAWVLAGEDVVEPGVGEVDRRDAHGEQRGNERDHCHCPEHPAEGVADRI